ncbi:lysylphosphatidylglycerol synthetase-like protein (DUF2156 family) [Buttiauxella sp. BIGb0471]|uniref:DUF202 domain-containing protein n=1 Tax=Buttiauxella sp. BIGb0471 TaxID=2940597 RepID=UPI00216A9B6A|nr:DUF202 domain-containing protein [Buttiauxella sp. BIGb0471]MCS3601602.1 lysylphosphatidylglycerol synthetase-like protein (DUF2156 family) [Buttiauxella sp. BIGb0471]
MADSRRQRRIIDPGLQPERTSLAWFRTLLGYGALLILALRHHRHHSGNFFWLTFIVLTLVMVVIYRYARQRNLMDIAVCDFSDSRTTRAKLLIALAVCSLALLFASAHVSQLVMLWEKM